MVEKYKKSNKQFKSYVDYPSKEEADNLPSILIKRYKYAPTTYMTLVGIHHQRTPDDPQFALLDNEFKSWIKKTEGTKRAVIVEGRISQTDNITTDEDAIHSERGEMTLVTRWAKNHEVTVIAGEPQPLYVEAHAVAIKMSNDQEVIAKGLTGRDVTAYYYFLRQLIQWPAASREKNIDVKNYMQQTIERYRDAWKWNAFDFSYERFLDIHTTLYNEPLDPLNSDFILQQTQNMHGVETPVQRVAALVRNERDKYLANLYSNLWDEGISVFSLYGRSHLWRMEDVFNYYGLPSK